MAAAAVVVVVAAVTVFIFLCLLLWLVQKKYSRQFNAYFNAWDEFRLKKGVEAENHNTRDENDEKDKMERRKYTMWKWEYATLFCLARNAVFLCLSAHSYMKSEKVTTTTVWRHSSWFFDSNVRALPPFFLRQMKSEMCAKEDEAKEEEEWKIRHSVCSLCVFAAMKIAATNNNQMNTKCFLCQCACAYTRA